MHLGNKQGVVSASPVKVYLTCLAQSEMWHFAITNENFLDKTAYLIVQNLRPMTT